MKRKIIQICPISPVPVTGGRQLRSFHLLEKLLEKHEVTLLTGYRNESEREALEQLKGTENLQVEMFPCKRGKAGGIFKIFRPIRRRRDAAIAERVRALQDKNAQVVKMDTLVAAAYLEDVKTGNHRWLDQQNVESGILFREAEQMHGFRKLKRSMQAWLYLREEKLLLRKMDLVTAVSEDDAKIFKTWCTGNTHIEVVPNGVTPPEVPPPLNGLPCVMFLAPMRYPPNWEALSWFMKEIWPKIIETVPAAKFHVVGKITVQQQKSLPEVPGVIFHGFLESLHDAYGLADILVVPLRSGGGTKLKVLEGMAYNRAAVCTPVALEGLDLKHPEEVRLVETAEEVADAILELIADPAQTRQMAEQGREAVCSRYHWNICGEKQETAFIELCKNRIR